MKGTPGIDWMSALDAIATLSGGNALSRLPIWSGRKALDTWHIDTRAVLDFDGECGL